MKSANQIIGEILSFRSVKRNLCLFKPLVFTFLLTLVNSQTMLGQSLMPGLSDTGSTAFSQDSGDIPGIPEIGDNMGSAVASGDFNGDSYVDLAIGNPGEAISVTTRAGSVTILYGSAVGLSTQNSVGFSQNTGNIPGAPEVGDGMGSTLAAADFNGDTFVDLAVGVPGENIGDTVNAGSVDHPIWFCEWLA